MNDLKFACRQLLKNPGFTAVAVLTLALGIGANIVVLGWIRGVLLNAVPGAHEPERLAAVAVRAPWGLGETMSYPNLRDLGAEREVFAGVVGSAMESLHVRHGEKAVWAWTELVTANFFDVLGVRPVLGQLAFPAGSDERPGSAPLAVLSERFWRRELGADPAIVGQTLAINRHPFTVLGVAAGEFQGLTGGLAFDVWVPVAMHREVGFGSPADKRGWTSYHTVARLQPGVSVARADAAAQAVTRRLQQAYPDDFGDGRHTTFTILPMWRCPWGAPSVFLPLLRALAVAAALVLVLVIANLANLQIARALTRSREMAVRLAVGAGRWRLVRQLLVESLLLAGVGGAAGLLAAAWGLRLIHFFLPSTHLPITLELRLDVALVAGTAGLAMLAGVLFGLVPAWQAAGTSLAAAMNAAARGSEGAGSGGWLRRGLVVAQLALALVLLVASALCVRSFEAARRLPLGFDPRGVAIAGFHLEAHGLDGAGATRFAAEVRRELLAHPEIEAVAFSETLPLGFEGGPGGNLTVPGETLRPGENRQAYLNKVTPGWFAAMRTPIVAGREFREDDDGTAPARIVINETAAARVFPGRSPLGLKVSMWGRDCEVIGVAAAGKYRHLAEPPAMHVWVAQAQWGETDLAAVVRTRGSAAAAVRLLEAAARRVSPGVQAFATGTLEEHVSAAFLVSRIAAVLLTLLGGVALVLALLGIYGVLAFQVNRRRRELGIRLALGAQRGDVLRLVLRHGLALAGVGLLLGLAGAFGATRVLGSFLVGVTAQDPLTFAGATLLLAAAAVAACWLPARRAARVDPMIALRSE
jgi:predicted permease